MKITIAHSPDSDDAFMFYALASGRIDTGDYHIEHVLCDIETLNRAAELGRYEVSAISLHAYPYLSSRYQLMPCGASVGDNYGPIVVSTEAYSRGDFRKVFADRNQKKVIGIPGEKTTAFLALKLFMGSEFQFEPMPFDQIIPACVSKQIDAGLIIHEGQLHFADHGLRKVLDLGSWWREETKLPLPLGGNVIRRDLGAEHIAALNQLVQKSIAFALDEKNQEEAFNYAMQFARGLDRQQAERFVRMYVNNRTLGYDADSIKAIDLMFERAAAKGYIPKQQPIARELGASRTPSQ